MSYLEKSEDCIETAFSLRVYDCYPRVGIETENDEFLLSQVSDFDLIRIKNIYDRALWEITDEMLDRNLFNKMEVVYEHSKNCKEK